MVKQNNKVKHIVGKQFFDDKFGKHKPYKIQPIRKKKKHILHSPKIERNETVSYIEIRRSFSFNYIGFVNSVDKQRTVYSDINRASLFSHMPKLEVAIKETYPHTKYFIAAVPTKKWNRCKNKIELLHHLYPEKFYPDLYIINKESPKNI